MKTRLASFALILLALTLAPASAAVRYVNVTNPNPALPYIAWASAATNIQDAIDAADAGDEIVVTNGVYATGGRPIGGPLTNRVAVTKPLRLRSVNGPEVTVIKGCQAPLPGGLNADDAVRCVYLTNGAFVIGFTLTNGAVHAPGGADSEFLGGGAFCWPAGGVLSNCVLTGNTAYSGGGAFG